MRPKNTYTKEEYNKAIEEVNNLKRELSIVKKELEDTKHINSILVQREQGKSYEEIKRIIAEDSEKRKLEEKWVRHPYYKDIKTYVDMGITDINVIAQFIGKSYASVRRALQDMKLYPIKEKSLDNMKLNL